MDDEHVEVDREADTGSIDYILLDGINTEFLPETINADGSVGLFYGVETVEGKQRAFIGISNYGEVKFYPLFIVLGKSLDESCDYNANFSTDRDYKLDVTKAFMGVDFDDVSLQDAIPQI